MVLDSDRTRQATEAADAGFVGAPARTTLSERRRATPSERPRAALYTILDSPIGELLLLGDGRVLRGLYMQGGRKPIAIRPSWRSSSEAFADARAQLREYFAGERTAFDVALLIDGDPFEQLVWRALREIPYGET